MYLKYQWLQSLYLVASRISLALYWEGLLRGSICVALHLVVLRSAASLAHHHLIIKVGLVTHFSDAVS